MVRLSKLSIDGTQCPGEAFNRWKTYERIIDFLELGKFLTQVRGLIFVFDFSS